MPAAGRKISIPLARGPAGDSAGILVVDGALQLAQPGGPREVRGLGPSRAGESVLAANGAAGEDRRVVLRAGGSLPRQRRRPARCRVCDGHGRPMAPALSVGQPGRTSHRHRYRRDGSPCSVPDHQSLPGHGG